MLMDFTLKINPRNICASAVIFSDTMLAAHFLRVNFITFSHQGKTDTSHAGAGYLNAKVNFSYLECEQCMLH